MATGKASAALATSAKSTDIPLTVVLQKALAQHQSGNLDAAESGYRAILGSVPHQADALQLLGVLRHQRGHSEDGLALLRRAAQSQPNSAAIRNNLGGVLRDMGRLNEAEKELAQAVALAPDAENLLNHGIVLEQVQRFDEAAREFKACLSRAPSDIRPLRRLSIVLLRLARHAEAEELLRRLKDLTPDDPEILGDLGIALQGQGRLAEAEEAFRAALALATDKPALRSSIYSLMNSELRDETARQAFREVLRADPEAWKTEMLVANTVLEAGRLEQAQQILDDILAVHAENAQVWNDAGAVLLTHGKHRESIAYFQKAIALDPEQSNCHCNLGGAYLHLQMLPEAVKAYRQALTRDPANFRAQISMIRALRLLDKLDEAHIFARSSLDLRAEAPEITAHIEETEAMLLQFLKTVCDFDGLDRLGDVWAIGDAVRPQHLPSVFLDQLVFADTKADIERFISLVRKWSSYVETLALQGPLPPLEGQSRTGKLRIGFLSSDLRSHSVARFATPLIEGYDREKFEFYCYAPIRAEADPVQKKLSGLVDGFRYVDGMTNREIAQAIRADAVDILIDLNGFTQHSRIAAMAYKPAPVQMSWLGYPFTAGLKAIDYIVMDRFVAPEGESTLVEEPIVMPDAWICFGKFRETPIAAEPPVARNGFITFGTLNNPYKYNRENIALWARVMRSVPESRFLMVRPEASSVTLVRHIAQEFAKHGISSERLFVRNNRAEGKDHLSYYNEMDMSLDTYPVTGGTTTCDALWMGVPVVAMVGPAYHHRISAAILRHCGLDELVAETPDEFVAKALAVANDPAKIVAWRSSLREIMRSSPLCDEMRFVHQFQEMLEQVATVRGLR